MSMSETSKDQINGKVVSHLRLKVCIMEDRNYYDDKYYTKTTIENMCSL